MRLFLDTNILVFFLYDQDELCKNTKECLFDYSNTLFTSTVCAQELIHLCQIGKISQDSRLVLDALFETGIKIEQITTKHLSELAKLPIYDDHRDPNDRMIIAQAISDKVSLISSDRKFSRYCRYGLDFIFNER